MIVVSTSDQAAPMRIRASNLATAISEGFRDEGRNVLMLMDSLTRFAMAQEIGLAAGEPPASRDMSHQFFLFCLNFLKELVQMMLGLSRPCTPYLSKEMT